METLMSLGFEMQAFYFNAIEILGRPRRLDFERVVLSEGCQFHCRLVASIDKGNRVIRTEFEKKTRNIWRTLSKGLENSKVSTSV